MTTPPTAELFSKSLTKVGAQLRDRLAEARAGLRHPGGKGTHAEQAFRDVLARYLPRRLAIGQGEIVDTSNRRSSQTDVIIANEDQPLIFPQEEPGLFLIEGVDAAGEVKSVLNSDELHRAIINSQRFKTLDALPAIGMRMAKASDIVRFHDHRPWFLFAYESQLTLETVAEHLVSEGGKLSQDPDLQVDAVFLLDRGAVINLGDGAGSFEIQKPDGSPYSGWVIIPESEMTLYTLIAWLSVTMPRIHRMTPLLPEYLSKIVR